MTRPRLTGDAARASTSRAGFAGHRPTVPARPRRPRPVRCAEPLEPRRLLSTLTVTTEADAGPGSLRQAILDSNALPGRDEIRFDIPGAGIHTIRPASPLPELTDVVTIDGRSQSGYAGSPLVELDGSAAGLGADGIVVRRWSTLLSGLAIDRFSRHGIVVRHTDQRPAVVIGDTDTTILFCRIGTNPAGDAAAGNGGAGILVESPGVVIGGPAALGQKPANVISGNGLAGIWVTAPRPPAGAPTSGVVSIGANYIGTDVTGTRAVGNGGEGVLVTSFVPVRVGYTPGPSPASNRNVISGNAASGVRISGPPGSGATHSIANNYIGLSAFGNAPLGNGTSPDRAYRDGITVEGGTSVGISGNVVSANADDGVRLSAITGSAKLTRNFIGTNADGSVAIGNDGNGLVIEGCRGVTVGEPADIAPEPNYRPPFSNVISGNRGDGVLVRGAVDGVLPLAPAAAPSSIVIQHNAIGSGAGWLAPLGNGGSGIYLAGVNGAVIGGDAFNAGNGIANNGGDGVTLAEQRGVPSGDNRIERNVVGGDGAFVNRRHGVNVLNGSSNRILRNFIAAGPGAGVVVQAGRGNVISQNQIAPDAGQPIDLAPGGEEGRTPNDIGDADTGPNDLQNAPVLESATFWPGIGANVAFHLNSQPSHAFHIELFSGGVYVATVDVTTDAEGNSSGVARLAADRRAAITATATEVSTGDTSESSFAEPPLVTPIAGGYFFYNNSAFDGRDPAANPGDDGAIAPDKHPLLSGTRPPSNALPANYTTYDKGINGIMLDLAAAPPGAPPVTAADFQFVVEDTVRQDGRVVSRTRPAPAPSAITVRPGAGIGGTDRVTITWPDGAIRNAWLRVTYLRPDPAQRVTLSFGNLAGNSAGWGFPSGPGARMYARVDAMDLAAMKSRVTGATAGLTSRYDHNRDGRVDLLDFAVARSNVGAVLQMYWNVGL